MDNKTRFSSTDEYIATFPDEIQVLLQQIRETIKAAAPDATEKISYGMPAFAYKGNLVYFAAWKNHIGFYAASGEAVDAFQDELLGYEVTKGTIKLYFDKALPVDLITKIVQYRVTQNLQKAEQKAKKKK
jgi:uncharacterized protein YdhG (YjbR/CyaY superfamily)